MSATKKAAFLATLKVRVTIFLVVLGMILFGLAGGLLIAAIQGQAAAAQQQQPLNGVMIDGIPVIWQDAYYKAMSKIEQHVPGCKLTPGIIAATGGQESGYAQGENTTAPDGARRPITIGADGTVSPTIRAYAPLPAREGEHDNGVLDGDATQDWAVGPMQFAPATFYGLRGNPALVSQLPNVPADQNGIGYGRDGNDDGIVNVNNIYDAVLGGANHLCSASPTKSLVGANGQIDDNAALAAFRAYGGSDSIAQSRLAEAKEIDLKFQQAAAAQGMTGGAITPGGSATGPNGSVSLSNVPGIGPINSSIAAKASAMLAAAQRDGVRLTGGSFRDGAQQIALRRAHCGTSYYAIYQMSPSACRPPTARPGASQHEVGLAIDFDNCSYRSTACFRWLASNAAGFGFYNLPSEPWHWSTTGS